MSSGTSIENTQNVGDSSYRIYSSEGQWYSSLDLGNAGGTSLQISGPIHTHLTGKAPNGGTFLTYIPSPDDRNVAATYSGLNQYLMTNKGTIQYDKDGNTIPGGEAPGSNCN